MDINRFLKKHDYFKDVLINLAREKLHESPPLNKIGLSSSGMTIARRDMEEAGIDEDLLDYLSLLSTAKINDHFLNIYNGFVKGIVAKGKKDESTKQFLVEFNIIYIFLSICMQEEGEFRNMLRLFMKQPNYFFESRSAELLMETFDGESFEKKKRLFAVLAQIWFRLITESKIEDVDLNEIAMATQEFQIIMGRRKILEKSHEILSEIGDDSEIMFITNGLNVPEKVMQFLNEKMGRRKLCKIIHNRPVNDKWKEQYPDICQDKEGRVKTVGTDNIRLLLVKGAVGFYCNSKSTKEGGEESEYAAFFTRNAAYLKTLEITFNSFWNKKTEPIADKPLEE